MEFHGKGILLDIEGTTSSIRFVYDEMFPYARRELNNYLKDAWTSPELEEARNLMAVDAGFADWPAWIGEQPFGESTDKARQLVADEASRLMDGDVKATGLKQLQGLIWKSGFHSGELKAHLYDDVPAAIESWNRQGGFSSNTGSENGPGFPARPRRWE